MENISQESSQLVLQRAFTNLQAVRVKWKQQVPPLDPRAIYEKHRCAYKENRFAGIIGRVCLTTRPLSYCKALMNLPLDLVLTHGSLLIRVERVD